MKTFNLGKTADGRSVNMDIAGLIRSRLLVQAASGGGKSSLMRLIAEHAGDTQFFILDPEGEFFTLREAVNGLLIVGQRGDIQADPKTAKVLARRLLEIGASAVIDLSDLPLPQRRQYVRFFCESLMSAPQSLQHDLLVLIDEAHLFVPERSAGESESTAAVIDLMSRGRKRKYAGILATQRLSKLHKDAAAECANVLIGRTTLDVDQKRAIDTLGMSNNERHALRDLETGEFFAFGPALLHTGVLKFQSNLPRTKEPERGAHLTRVAPASGQVQKMIAELTDLAKKDEDKPITIEDAEQTIQKLRRQLKATEKAVGGAKPAPPTLDTRQAQKIAQETRKACEIEFQQQLSQLATETMRAINDVATGIDSQRTALHGLIRTLQKSSRSKVVLSNSVKPTVPIVATRELRSSPPRSSPSAASPVFRQPSDNSNRDQSLGRCERAILSVLATHGACAKNKIGIIAGYSPSSGGFNNSLSKLRQAAYVSPAGSELIDITDGGIDALGEFDALPTGDALHSFWYNKLPKAEATILRTLIDENRPMTKQEIGEVTGYSPTSGGFNNSLSRLRTLELIEGYGQITASQSLFE